MEAEAGGLWTWGQPWLCSEMTLPPPKSDNINKHIQISDSPGFYLAGKGRLEVCALDRNPANESSRSLPQIPNTTSSAGNTAHWLSPKHSQLACCLPYSCHCIHLECSPPTGSPRQSTTHPLGLSSTPLQGVSDSTGGISPLCDLLKKLSLYNYLAHSHLSSIKRI